jgi:hypothetical protein
MEPSAPAAATCRLCSAVLEPGTGKRVTTIKGRTTTTVEVCPKCAETVRADLAAEQAVTVSHFLPGFFGGLIGGAIGAAV